MKQTKIVAFDDHLVSLAGEPVIGASSDQHALILGLFDQLSFCMTGEQVSGSNPSVAVQIMHSADGVHWLPKSPDAPELPATPLEFTTTNPMVGFDDGTVPSLRYVKLLVTVTTVEGGCDVAVRLDVVLNDKRDNRFAREMQRLIDEQADMNKCQEIIQGGSFLGKQGGLGCALCDVTGLGDEVSCTYKSSADADWQYQDPATVCYLADDARACVLADGTTIVSSPRGQHAVAPAAARGGDGQGC